MLGKYFPVVLGINADAATATNQIYNEIKKQKIKLDIKNWTNEFSKQRKDYLTDREKNNLGKNFPIQPKGLFKQLRKALPKDTAITLDAGTLCLQATDALEYYNPPSLFHTFRFWFSRFFVCLRFRS
jgi:thiamine pyrophosphate-dependent acetolactate synthase large subunit-like protein